MHQPWASLLVYGIKRIEGRGWPTEHRGRLWIAATAKQPTPQEIQVRGHSLGDAGRVTLSGMAGRTHAPSCCNTPVRVCARPPSPGRCPRPCTVQEMEEFYRAVHGSGGQQAVELPPAYPTGVLLGCVDVVGCLSVSRRGGSGDGSRAAECRVPLRCTALRPAALPELCLLLQAEQVEAWEGLPGGLIAEVGSPYCFLCQAPQRLVVPQQMRGFPKIFQLEKKVGAC